MALISTRELFDEFYREKDTESVRRVRPTLENPQLFAYEELIGKQLVDMSADEIIELFKRFKGIKQRTILQLQSYYKNIINYYSFHYEPVVNVFLRDDFRGMGLINKLNWNKYSVEYLEECIKEVRSVYSDNVDKCDYLECIIRMFFDGFSNAIEIAELQESDICFETREVDIKGRKITLSKRTMFLLNRIHNLETISSYRELNYMESWHGSYFKFPVRAFNIDKVRSYDMPEVRGIINRKMAVDINKACGLKLDYFSIYYLGVFQKFIEYCGSKERAIEIINSNKPKENAKFVEKFINDNKLSVTRPAYLYMQFKEFI